MTIANLSRSAHCMPTHTDDWQTIALRLIMILVVRPQELAISPCITNKQVALIMVRQRQQVRWISQVVVRVFRPSIAGYTMHKCIVLVTSSVELFVHI